MTNLSPASLNTLGGSNTSANNSAAEQTLWRGINTKLKKLRRLVDRDSLPEACVTLNDITKQLNAWAGDNSDRKLLIKTKLLGISSYFSQINITDFTLRFGKGIPPPPSVAGAPKNTLLHGRYQKIKSTLLKQILDFESFVTQKIDRPGLARDGRA